MGKKNRKSGSFFSPDSKQTKSPIMSAKKFNANEDGDEKMDIDVLSNKRKSLNNSLRTPNNKNAKDMHVSFQLPKNSSVNSASKIKHPLTPMPKKKVTETSATKGNQEFRGMNTSLQGMKKKFDQLVAESDDEDEDDDEEDDDEEDDDDIDEEDDDESSDLDSEEEDVLRKKLLDIKQKQLSDKNKVGPQKQGSKVGPEVKVVANQRLGAGSNKIPVSKAKSPAKALIDKLQDEDDESDEDEDSESDEQEIHEKLVALKKGGANAQLKVLSEEESDEEDDDDDDDDDDDSESDESEEETKQKPVIKIAQKFKKEQLSNVSSENKTPKKALKGKSGESNQTLSASIKKPQQAEIKQTNPVKSQISSNEEEMLNERKRQRDLRNLFVKGLPTDVSAEELKTLSPDILSVNIPIPKYKKNLRYAFMEFANEMKAEKNYALLQNKKFRGESLFIDFCGEKRKTGVPSPDKRNEEPKLYNKLKLFVSGLPCNATINQVAALFPKAFSVSINQSPTFRTASIMFSKEADAANALKSTEKSEINGRPLTVLYSLEKAANKKKRRKNRKSGNASPPMKKVKREGPIKSEDTGDDDDDDDDDDEDD